MAFNFNINKLFDPLFKAKQEEFEGEFIRQHVQPGDVALAVGANIVDHAKHLSELVGKMGRVHCLESDAVTFAKLRLATKRLANVFGENAGVGAVSGVTIYRQSQTAKQDVSVRVLNIDDYLLRFGPRLDFIKLDVYGYEADALKGMAATLALNPTMKMISEFWPHGLREAGSSPAEYLTALRARAFDVQLLGPNGLVPLDPEKAKEFESLDENQHFNIFASRAKN